MEIDKKNVFIIHNCKIELMLNINFEYFSMIDYTLIYTLKIIKLEIQNSLLLLKPLGAVLL